MGLSILCPVKEIMKKAGVRTILKLSDMPIAYFEDFYSYFSGNFSK